MTSRTVYGYSTDAEDVEWFGKCSTREEAIAEAPRALELHPGDAFWIVQGEYASSAAHVPTPFDLKDWLMTSMEESLDDRNSMPGQGFDVADGAFEELRAVIKEWAGRHLAARKWLLTGSPEKCVYSPASEAPPAKESNGAGKTEEVA